MTMGKLTLVGVLREHVPVFDVEGFADAEGHEKLTNMERG
jgi:hypothetical protein